MPVNENHFDWKLKTPSSTVVENRKPSIEIACQQRCATSETLAWLLNIKQVYPLTLYHPQDVKLNIWLLSLSLSSRIKNLFHFTKPESVKMETDSTDKHETEILSPKMFTCPAQFSEKNSSWGHQGSKNFLAPLSLLCNFEFNKVDLIMTHILSAFLKELEVRLVKYS